MSNGLLYIAGLISLALAALFAVPYFVDWNGYRGVFEEEATRILGREVRVGGNVNVRLLPAPFVRFDKLRIADTTGIAGEPLFRADSFTMRLSVPPLLKGIIEANEIELKRPVVHLGVDADGAGNWRSLSITPGTLPFVPAGVTLQSVKIKDGVIALHGPKGIGFAEIDGLNGELKAETIEGPFSFKGAVNWKGAEREVRVATDAADAQGAIRFKSTIHGSKRDNAYTVDGRISDLKGHPRIEGDVTAKLELDAEPASASEESRSVKPEIPLVDFKASLAGDAKGLRLDDITLSFERVGQPQLITGAASASWSDALSVDLNLASRWLDLDRISGGNGGASPFDTARSFVTAVMQALPTNAETKVRFDLDQANLGGEAVSGIRLEVARTGGTLLLKDLRAGMPGGAKLTLDGTIAGVENARAFQGELALRGTSLARFLNWAAKDQELSDSVQSDGPFSLQGRLGLSEKAIDLTDAGAEIGGTPLTGEMHYSRGERTRLSLVLEGQVIDAGRLWPVGVGYLKARLIGGKQPSPKEDAAVAAAQSRWFDVSNSDLALRLRAGKLMTGRQPLRDVDMDVAIDQGQLAVRACKFATDDGFALELEGNIADVAGQPRGALQWIVAASAKKAYSDFVRLLDLPEDVSQEAMRYVALAPLRLAGSFRLGERTKRASDIFVDGSVQGGRVIATARLDGGLENWRDAGADLALTVDSPDVVQAIDNLTARSSGPPAEPQQRAGEIFFKAVGTPAKGLLATASVKADGLFFAYDGRIELPADASHKFEGEMRISSRELGDVMAIGGLGSGGAMRGIPIVGRAKVVSANHAIEIKPQKLTVGGSTVDGTMALAYPQDGPAIVTAQLEVDKASIPGLLNVALDRASTSEIATEPLTEGKTIWPESAFDFAALDGIEGKLGVTFGALSLDKGMAISKARLEVELAPGKISVSKLEGTALGGDVFAALALHRAPGGASLAGDVRLTGAHLGSSASAKTTPQKDTAAALSLEFSGRGATPGGLIAVATGKGELSLGDMTMRVPTPLAVIATAEAVLTGEAGGSGEALTSALIAKIAASEVKVGPRTIAIAIADGAAKFEPFTLPSPAGATKVETTVDLSSLMVDSTWLLEPKAPDLPQPDQPRKGALPSVNVVYVGPLKDAWLLEPRIAADQLERELAIRKMELDADQLERLHKLDAERARQEEERRKAIEDEQSNAPTAPAPPDAATAPAPVAQPADGAAAQPPAGAPLPAPGEVSGAAVPAVPGPEAQVLPAQAGDAPSGELTPQAPAATPAPPQTTYRPRRTQRRQVPAGEQVLRALQNNRTN